MAPPPEPGPSASAYGGPNWTPRAHTLREEIGRLWASCGVASEWTPLRSVLLHRPGEELAGIEDPDAHLMLAPPDPGRVRAEHDGVADAYRKAGVEVHYVDPPVTPPPNQMFCADLLFLTPEGAIVGRPASTVRAGEERWIARRLADLGVPILRTVSGDGVFEGADAQWIRSDLVLLGMGLRTNREGADQVASALEAQGVRAIRVDLPHGAMHLMGQVRIVDRDLAFVQEGRTPWSAVTALAEAGYEVAFFPSAEEIVDGMAHNFVVLGPRRILMPAGNPVSREAFESRGLECVEVEVESVCRAAGAIGCLTGVLARAEEREG